MTEERNHSNGRQDRWEYMTMSYSYSYGSTAYSINEQKESKLKNRPLHEVLTLFGQHGWDLTSVGGAEGKTFIFKRRMQQVQRESAAEEIADS